MPPPMSSFSSCNVLCPCPPQGLSARRFPCLRCLPIAFPLFSWFNLIPLGMQITTSCFLTPGLIQISLFYPFITPWTPPLQIFIIIVIWKNLFRSYLSLSPDYKLHEGTQLCLFLSVTGSPALNPMIDTYWAINKYLLNEWTSDYYIYVYEFRDTKTFLSNYSWIWSWTFLANEVSHINKGPA